MKEEIVNEIWSAILPYMERFADVVAAKVTYKVQREITPPEPKFYNRRETAQLLCITLPTLQNLTADGRLTAKRVGRRVLYNAAEIDALVASGEKVKYIRRS